MKGLKEALNTVILNWYGVFDNVIQNLARYSILYKYFNNILMDNSYAMKSFFKTIGRIIPA